MSNHNQKMKLSEFIYDPDLDRSTFETVDYRVDAAMMAAFDPNKEKTFDEWNQMAIDLRKIFTST